MTKAQIGRPHKADSASDARVSVEFCDGTASALADEMEAAWRAFQLAFGRWLLQCSPSDREIAFVAQRAANEMGGFASIARGGRPHAC